MDEGEIGSQSDEPDVEIYKYNRISRSTLSLVGDGGFPKFARKFRRWSSSISKSPTTDNVPQFPEPSTSQYDKLTAELGHFSTTRSCIDVSMQKPLSTNASISKSTSQLETVGTMKATEPSNNVRNKILESQKKLSISSPIMSSSPSINFEVDDALAPHSNRRRNDKFHKIFKNVPEEEKILNFYSCALVGDILLQGHLYITDNYFGFYSNILGHITKILIPVKKVTEIKKVKTVKVIPNAVKVVADTKKFTFTSLMSRDATLRLMVKVWRKSRPQEGEVDSLGSAASSCASSMAPDDILDGSQLLTSEDPSNNDQDSNVTEPLTSPTSGSKPTTLTHVFNAGVGFFSMAFPVQKVLSKLRETVINLSSLPRTTLFLGICTLLLVFLYISAAFLIYRVSTMHWRYGLYFPGDNNDREHNFHDVYRWNSQLRSESIESLQDVLGVQIKQLAEVRKSLQTLKTLTDDANVTTSAPDILQDNT